MKYIKIVISFLFLFFISCNKQSENKAEKRHIEKQNIKIVYEKVAKENLPKEIVFEGNIKEITRLNDSKGKHIILLTETGETPSKKIVITEGETDFKIFAYDYLLDKNENTYKLNWKIQDFIFNCEFDLIMGFVKDSHKITDLDKDGISEIWLMYEKTCTSDVSPSEMKIIMYEGKMKYALRGNSIVTVGIDENGIKESMGGDYKLDENFINSPKEFKEGSRPANFKS